MCLLQPIRVKRGLTQEQLSKRIMRKTGVNISAATISLFETNKRPMTPLQMRAVCIALRTTEAKLYEWNE
ncbi:helix-turn-helix domain-containing protein [Paenibacillus graminis]